jgi:thioredoxin reductase (NADPH)
MDEIIDGDFPFYLIIDEERILARTVIVATGSEPRPLEIKTKTKTPVSYCALCDGSLYKGKKVAVIGGGNSALQESLYLADLAKTVTIFSHHDLKAEPYLLTKVESINNIDLKQHTEPTAEMLDEYDAVFAFIGKRPATSFLGKGFDGDEPGDEYERKLLDEDGYIITKDCYTAIPGLFAAGDVCKDSVKQVVAATASGANAALHAIELLKRQK